MRHIIIFFFIFMNNNIKEMKYVKIKRYDRPFVISRKDNTYTI